MTKVINNLTLKNRKMCEDCELDKHTKEKEIIVGWKYPYNTRDARSIKTYRGGQWEYAPLFREAIGQRDFYHITVDIFLTGSRYRDFKEANSQAETSEMVNGSGKTWHHTYIEEIQQDDFQGSVELVDTPHHRSTVPHVGCFKQYKEYILDKQYIYEGDLDSVDKQESILEKMLNSKRIIQKGVEYRADSSIINYLEGEVKIIYEKLNEYKNKDFVWNVQSSDINEIINFFSFDESENGIKHNWIEDDYKMLENGYFWFGTNKFGDMYYYDLVNKKFMGLYLHEYDVMLHYDDTNMSKLLEEIKYKYLYS